MPEQNRANQTVFIITTHLLTQICIIYFIASSPLYKLKTRYSGAMPDSDWNFADFGEFREPPQSQTKKKRIFIFAVTLIMGKKEERLHPVKKMGFSGNLCLNAEENAGEIIWKLKGKPFLPVYSLYIRVDS